jgi:polar amino acid transport system permease protein
MAFDFTVLTHFWPRFLEGAANTLWLSSVSAFFGTILGVGVATLRLSRIPFGRYLARGYVEVIRGTPIVVQIFIIYYALPEYGVKMSAISAGILSLTFYMSAYAAEVVRAGILSIPRGQIEAARAVGMSSIQLFRRITLPLMVPLVLPPFTNEFVNLIKWSSVLSVITVAELTYVGNEIIFSTFSPIEALTVVALLYWLMNDLFVHLSQVLERHVKRHY